MLHPNPSTISQYFGSCCKKYKLIILCRHHKRPKAQQFFRSQASHIFSSYL
ncbi:hypothetical protein Hanom_Chr16g01416771 [Helianthus anomalus]